MPHPDADTLDAHAFADACEAAPDVDPDTVRRIADAYTAGLHIHVVAVHSEHALTEDEANALFRKAATSQVSGGF